MTQQKNFYGQNVYVEFHDARFTKFELTPSGDIVVEFSHLPVYQKETEEHYTIWSYQAVLRLSRVSNLSMDQIQCDWIMEDNLFADDHSLLTSFSDNFEHVRAFEFTLIDGAVIRGNVSTMSLSLTRRGEKSDDWRGPLLQ